MSDLSITPASVLASSSGQKDEGIAGGTITAGMAVYIDTADSNKLKASDADGAAPANQVRGIALHAAFAGQPLKVATVDDSLVIGATISVGDVIYLSPTGGGALTVDPDDVETGDTVTVVGIGVSTTAIRLQPLVGGVKA